MIENNPKKDEDVEENNTSIESFDRPKVFLSYSWSSKEHQDRVISFAMELMKGQNIEVVLDVFDLKEGQDKYKFMERCVNDQSIDHVLIICDKQYTEKANDRVGGVGTETAIITPELYDKWDQTRFVPIVFERGDDGDPYLPTYLKSRMYFDLSGHYNNYDFEYEKLIRYLWGEPLIKKPIVEGGKPDWLNNKSTNLSKMQRLVKEYSVDQTNYRKKEDMILLEYINGVKQSWKEGPVSNAEIYGQIMDSKPIQDLFTEFLAHKISSEQSSIGSDIAGMLERINNDLLFRSKVVTFDQDYNQVAAFLLHELLIRISAIMAYYGEYKSLGQLVNHTYFMLKSSYDSLREFGIEAFFCHGRVEKFLTEFKVKRSNKSNLLSIEGEVVIERSVAPYCTKEQLVVGDMYLMQLAHIYTRKEQRWHWFPITYIYGETAYKNEWRRYVSEAFCMKAMPAFESSSISELKTKLKEKSLVIRGFTNCFSVPEGILQVVDIDLVGSLP